MTDETRPSPPDTPEEAPSPPPAAPSQGLPWRLVLSLALAALIVIFAVQNTQEVDLQFLVWTWRLPLVVIILIAVVASLLLDHIVGGIVKRRRIRRKMDQAELKRLRRGH